VTRAAELIDSGIRAYTRGQLAEAERCWSEALAAEPTNARARSYLDVLLGRKEAARRAEPEPPSQPAQPRAAEVDRRPVGARAQPRPTEPGPEIELEPRPMETERRAVEVEERSMEVAPPARDTAEAPVPLPSPTMASRPPVSPPASRATAPVPLPPPVLPRTTRPPQTLPWMIATGNPSAPPPTVVEADYAPALAPPEAAPVRIPPEEIAPPGPAAPEQPASDRPEHSTLSDYAPSPWDEGPALAPAVVIGEGDGLDLATVADQSDVRPLVPEQAPIPQLFSTLAPHNAVEVWMEGARELFALGDFSGSLEMLEKILKVDPSHEQARRYLKENESTLIAMYESKLGSRDCVPRLGINPEEVMWLNLDHRAGFLLAQIDGAVTYEDLFALSGLPRLDTARILATLLQEGVIQSG